MRILCPSLARISALYIMTFFLRQMQSMVDRKSNSDDCPALGAILCSDDATVLCQDRLHDGEAESRPAAALREERLEDAREVGRIEARTVVLHRAFDEAVALSGRHFDAVAGTRMLHGIVDEILENEVQTRRVHEDRRRRLNVGLERNAGIGGYRSARLHCLFEDGLDLSFL